MFWLEFIICSTMLASFAHKLCKEGILIAKKTSIEQALIGVFFLAVATSLPEIMTSVGSIYAFGNIDMGYSNIMGSVMINLMILALIGLFSEKGELHLRLSRSNLLTAVFAAIIAGFVLLVILFRQGPYGFFSLGPVGLESAIIVIVYGYYLRGIRKEPIDIERKNNSIGAVSPVEWTKFLLLFVVVVFLSMWLANIGDRIALLTDVGQSFVGSFLLGFVTSMPELIVSLSALFAGSPEMALGNIFGSNLFDICIIPGLDLITARPILGMLNSGAATATLFAFILSIFSILASSRKGKSARTNFINLLVFVMGLIGFMLIWYFK